MTLKSLITSPNVLSFIKGLFMKVYITRKIPEKAIDHLKQNNILVEVHEEDNAPDRDMLLQKSRNVEGVISLLSDTIDKEFFETAEKLKIVANYAVGYNNIDVEYARSKGVVVTNTPDVLTDATADLTWALILSVARRIVESDKFVRSGKFDGWGPLMFLGGEISGRTLGIVGAGRIGQAVGRRAVGFGMRILYAENERKPDFEKATGANRVDFKELLAESDIVTFHCPLTPETSHLLNKDTFKQIKKGAFVINTSRGPVLDEQALVEALKDGRLGGAGLDVYEHEPKIQPDLKELDNVVLLPHIGSATLKTRTEMGLIAARNIVAVLNGEPPITPVE